MNTVLSKRKFLLVWLLFVMLFQLKAQVFVLPDSMSHIPLSTYSYTYYDPENKEFLPPADSLFRKHEGIIFNLGRKAGTYWIKMDIRNIDSSDRNIIIECTTPNLGNIELYKRTDSVIAHLETLGAEHVYHSRPIKHQNLLFPIALTSQEEATYFFKIKSDLAALNFDLLLWDIEARKEYTLKESNVISYFFFIMTTFLVILGIVLIITKQKRQWSFFIYVFLGAAYTYCILGLSYKNIWSNSPNFQQIASYLFTNLYLIAGISFFREYFVTRRLLRRLDNILKILVYCSFVLTLCSLSHLWIPKAFFSVLQTLNPIIFSLAGILVTYILIFLLIHQRNKTETIWFLIAFAPHAYAIITSSLRQIGEYYFETELQLLANVPLFLWTIPTQNLMIWSMIWEVLIVFTLMMTRFHNLYEQNNAMAWELSKQKEKSGRMLMDSVEQERKRIAQELHDSSGVQLSSIRMKLTMLADSQSSNLSEDKIKEVMRDVDHVHHEIRTISHNLMPISLSKLGLKAAIQELINPIKASFPKKKIQLFQQYESQRLSEDLQVNLYRIIQELINNVMKHADASEITIQLITDGNRLIVSLEDNGKGFQYNAMQHTGLGLKGIFSRAQLLGGTCEIDSKEGTGTFIVITVPLL